MKIAIVGGTESWKDAPYGDSSWKIWLLGNQIQQFNHKRIDRIFEIHNDLSNRPPEYAQWLVDFGIPMVVGEEFPVEAAHAKVFDFARAKEIGGGDYLTSTPAYMIAQLLMEYHLNGTPVEEIGLWGIDMAVDDREYFYEQPCVQRWLGIAVAHGIKVTLPDGCPLGEPSYMEGVTANHPEGLTPYTESNFMELANGHQRKIDELQAKIAECESLIQTHGGCLQAYTRMAKVARATDAGQKFENLTQTVRML